MIEKQRTNDRKQTDTRNQTKAQRQDIRYERIS